MITFTSVHKTFEHKGKVIEALNDINLHIEKGEIFGIVGESGAGKSTLIRCANLLEVPTKGEVVVDGENLTQLSKQKLLSSRHNLGMIFQHFNLLSSRTVYDNIALPMELTNTSKANINKKVTELLHLTGLTDKASQYPAQLSGGQKQRVAIARALANNPKVLLSDEATSALDPETTESILSLLKEINQKLGLTILLITHEMSVVKQICDKVALIQNGKLVENDYVGNFFTNPQSDLGKRFVDKAHQFDLPDNIVSSLSNEINNEYCLPLVQLKFNDAKVSTPIISQMTRKFDIDVNIIQAKIEQIQDKTLGLMVAEFDGDARQNDNALAYLSEIELDYEVLGYVKRTH